jgi:hypothetical protein
MTVENKILATALIMFGSAAMILAIRWKNDNTDAGNGIAGWTILLILHLWW